MKNFKKGVDKTLNLWYNNYRKKERYTEMAQKKKNKSIDKRMFKKTGEELQQYLAFKKRGSVVENKKGKGSYNRQKSKRVGDDE